MPAMSRTTPSSTSTDTTLNDRRGFRGIIRSLVAILTPSSMMMRRRRGRGRRQHECIARLRSRDLMARRNALLRRVVHIEAHELLREPAMPIDRDKVHHVPIAEAGDD